MLKFIIQDKGFLINIGNKEIRTPATILCNEGDGKKITAELIQQGVVNYSIVSNVSNTPEINIDIDINVDKEFLVLKDKFILNYVKDNIDERDHKPLKLTKPILREMSSVSLASDYTSTMSPVKNQGSLGSCVGFAVVSMKEWQEQQEHLEELAEGKKYKRKAKNYDLSEQWLYYKCKEIDYWPEEEGTSIRFAMQILNKVGVPCEKAWPYDDDYKGEPKRWANLVSKWALGGEYLRLSSPEEIIKSLKENGPLPVGVGCFLEIFYTTSDGIVKDPADPNTCYGGHAICLVGWDPIKRMFKFKNSWGLDWGQRGYGYLSYNYIKNFCWDAWEIKDLSVTKEMLKG
jgi:C1A family cysteine protease